MLNYEFPPLGGGSGNATFQLLSELSQQDGVHIDLVTSSATKDFELVEFAPAIRLFRLPVGKVANHYWTVAEIARWFIRARRFVRQLTQETEYDLCHCWSGWPAGIVGYLTRQRMPYIVALRGSDVPGYNLRLRYFDPIVFRPLSRLVWGAAAAVTCVSGDLTRLAELSVRDFSPHIIGNGVDAAQFRPAETAGEFSILYVGRLIPRKGLKYLMRAFAELCAEGEDCRLVIAGDGPELPMLQSFCRQHNIDHKVDLLGEIPHEELPRVYACGTVFVMPALEEAMSNAVLEAMASGLAIITTNTGVFEVLHENGIVVEKRDHRQIKTALLRYLHDPGLVNHHGAQSRKLAGELTWSNVARAYLELYELVSAGKR